MGTTWIGATQSERFATETSLALAGIGIAYVVELLARPYLRDGSLKWLLPQTAVEHDGAFLYYPRRASLAPKLRAFIDVAKKTLKSFE
jgi:DNA-binding transcriptional LysR family regulator